MLLDFMIANKPLYFRNFFQNVLMSNEIGVVIDYRLIE